MLFIFYKMSESNALLNFMFCTLSTSGKIETWRYLKTLIKEDTQKFHLGETSTQVNDFSYFDGIKKNNIASKKVLGHTKFFNITDFNPFYDYDWANSINLLNDDY